MVNMWHFSGHFGLLNADTQVFDVDIVREITFDTDASRYLFDIPTDLFDVSMDLFNISADFDNTKHPDISSNSTNS